MLPPEENRRHEESHKIVASWTRGEFVTEVSTHTVEGRPFAMISSARVGRRGVRLTMHDVWRLRSVIDRVIRSMEAIDDQRAANYAASKATDAAPNEVTS